MSVSMFQFINMPMCQGVNKSTSQYVNVHMCQDAGALPISQYAKKSECQYVNKSESQNVSKSISECVNVRLGQ